MSDAEKGSSFAKHLKTVFTPNESQSNIPLQPPEIENPAVNLIINKKTLNAEIQNLQTKKAPGKDLITGKMIKELPQIGKKYLLHLCNAILRVGYFPKEWKVSKITMIAKPGKNPTLLGSYRPISLLSILSKLIEKLIIRVMAPHIDEKRIIPNYQFGFRKSHSTIEQVHRIVNEIQNTFEEGNYCSAVFLDITQAFDKVWHEGLLWKLQCYLPYNLYVLLKSYLFARKFYVQHCCFESEQYPIMAGVPQGSVLGPVLYLLFTADMPTTENTTISTFADDTAILSSNSDPKIANKSVQNHLNKLQEWLNNWRIKVNESKSTHVTFTLRQKNCASLQINDKIIPQSTETKYLGMHLDRRLTWKNHIAAKIKQMRIKQVELHWLINKNSKLSLNYKVQLYKAVIKPIWTYGIELWSSASPSNIEKLQTAQSKILRTMVGAPRYIKNANIHRDLNIPLVTQEVTKFTQKYKLKLSSHPNPLATNLLRNCRVHRLKRTYIHPAIVQ